jgi:hypothetical protein
MKRKKVVRNLTVGALATGLVPLSSAAVGAATSGDTPAGRCQATFGDHGPVGGPVVGEGPSGDPMGVTIGWESGDWPDGLREVVTCMSVDGVAVRGLTTSMASPPNSGTLTLNMMLPAGAPGALACEQSILFGAGTADGRHQTTSPVCFKLRAPEPEPPVRSDRRASSHDESSAPPLTPPSTPAARAALSSPSTERSPVDPSPVGKAPAKAAPGGDKAPDKPAPRKKAAAKAPKAKSHGGSGGESAAPYPLSTPPARAAFEAAFGLIRPPEVPAVMPAPAAAAAPQSDATPAETARAAAPTSVISPRTTPLPRTGVGDKIPLAAAGSLFALGGAAMILGEPRRRRPATRVAF